MKNMRIKRKNGSNKYVIRIGHLLDFIFVWFFSFIILINSQFFLYDEWLFLDYGEKVMYILGWLSIPIFVFAVIIFIKYPHFIIDFEKEYIIIRKVKYQLKDIVKIEYIKNTSHYDNILVYKSNDIIKFHFNTGTGLVNLERARGYPMAKKIEEINNKLQEYRKQNNL